MLVERNQIQQAKHQHVGYLQKKCHRRKAEPLLEIGRCDRLWIGICGIAFILRCIKILQQSRSSQNITRLPVLVQRLPNPGIKSATKPLRSVVIKSD